MIMNSLKTRPGYYTNPFNLPAAPLQFGNFAAMVSQFKILLQKMDMRTVMVALATLIARYTGDPPYQFAGLLLSAIPALLVYVVFQQYLIKGLTAGAIK
jgi:ABC-type maltose transport system permease subunit